MDEQTTTGAPVDTGGNIGGVAVDSEGRAVPQPETTEPAPAAEQPTEQPEPKTEEPKEAVSEPSEEEQLTKFAETKGLTLDSDNAKKAAKMAMEAEKRMHSATKQRSELEKTINTASDEYAEDMAEQTGQDPEVLKRLQRMEVKEAVRDFWTQDGVDRSYEPKMIEILGQKPHLAGDLDALYALAVRDDVKSQGKREALESLAHNQQAAVPTGNATDASQMSSSTQITPQNVDRMVASMSVEEYQRRLPEINKAMAG
jgi:hypothetical protein